jgi:hypothetical protein
MLLAMGTRAADVARVMDVAATSDQIRGSALWWTPRSRSPQAVSVTHRCLYETSLPLYPISTCHMALWNPL